MASKRQGSSHVGAQPMLRFTHWLRQCLNYYPTDKQERALLKRWLEHPDANKTWSAIRAHLERHEGPIGTDAPIYLIHLVLTAKKAAEREHEVSLKIVKSGRAVKKLLASLRTEITEGIRKLPEENLVPFLEFALDKLRPFRPVVTSPPRVRSDKGSRAKTLFIRDLSATVRNLTGKWLDKEVAVITEIAFGIDDIDAETIRKARQRRRPPP